MKIEIVDINSIKLNEDNPRSINDKNYKKLVKSIKDFPEMMKIRPIVVDNNGVVLGGNMRLRACIDAGLKEVPIIKADKLTEKQKKEFIIKDNISFGEWDYDILGNGWDVCDLADWGLEMDDDMEMDDDFDVDIKEPKEKKYNFTIKCEDEIELADIQRLIGCESSDIPYKNFIKFLNKSIITK